MGSEVRFEVGDLIQGGSYPEAIWEVTFVDETSESGQFVQLSAWYSPPGYWLPESPTCLVPSWDFELANAMLVVAVAAQATVL